MNHNPAATMEQLQQENTRLKAQLATANAEHRASLVPCTTSADESFRSLADQAPAMIWLADKLGKIEYFSQKWLSFTGLSAVELTNGWLSNVHPNDVSLCRTVFKRALECREGFSVEYRLRRCDGKYCFMLDTCVPRFHADGEFAGFIGSCIDISDRRQALEDLRQSETRFRAVFEHAATAIGLVEPESGVVLECNHALQRILGYTPDEISSMPWTEYTHPEDVEPNLSQYNRMLLGEIDHFHLDKRFIHKDGHVVWGRLTSSIVREADCPVYVVGLVEDITERKNTEERLSWTESLLRAAMASPSPFGYFAVDKHTDGILYFNQRFCQIWGVEEQAEQMTNGRLKNGQLLRACEDLVCNPEILSSIAGREQSEDEIHFRDGRVVRRFSTIIRDEHSTHLGRFYVFEDITERKQLEQALRTAKLEADQAREQAEVLACTDYLTRLFNRRAFMDRFQSEFSRARREKTSLSLILADVDRFKSINDQHGHLAGDLALQRFAKCLTDSCRTYDFIGRYGGEEFIICLPNTNQEQAAKVAERIRSAVDALRLPVPHSQGIISITASLGVASLGKDTEHDEDWLIKLADDAMYQAKIGGNAVHVAAQ